jgi:predicted phosphodiesterase
LNDVERNGGADLFWVLGDIVALGPSPVEVLEILQNLRNARFVRGNTDRYVYSGTDSPSPTLEDVARDPKLIHPLVECAGTFAWTQGMLCATGWLDWLGRLPIETEYMLPEGTRMLGVHASPGRDDGPGLSDNFDDAGLETLVADCPASLILAGHTHRPMNRIVGERRLVNLGSVSNPLPDNLKASYCVVSADPAGYEVIHRRVDYDRDVVIREMRRLRHPAARYVIHHLSGGELSR